MTQALHSLEKTPARRETDIAVVGGGLAGSLAAAMLGRAGHDAVLIDPHAVYPVDFRCEKLDGGQIKLLAKTGLADAVLKAATPDDEIWIARFGQLVNIRPNAQADIPYDVLVNAIRAQIPARTAFIEAKVANIAASDGRQIVTLGNGEEVSARLVVLANGLNCGLRRSLGIARKIVSPCHSVSVGFDCAPSGRPRFPFRALTYYPEAVSDRFAYLTLFPMGARTRANLFVYRDARDPWFKALRETPVAALSDAIPGLKGIIGDFAVTSEVNVRPVDLYVSENYCQPGIVLVGDAFATSCPAAGTGVSKVLTDVERLCTVHIPRWFETAGMGEEKIGDFYADPVKQACDRRSAAKAFFLRALSTEDGLVWRMQRGMRFYVQLLKGGLRQAQLGPAAGVPEPLGSAPERGFISQGN